VANVLQSNGPDGPGGVLLTLLRIVASGAAISAMFTAISLAASSLTERKAFATAGLILLFLVSSVVAGTLGGLLELGDNFFLLNLFYLPFEVVGRIHGEAGGTVDGDLPDVSTIAAFAAALGWTVLGAVIVRTRYRLLQVTR
jgi:ABC-2 type transport system permease protein